MASDNETRLFGRYHEIVLLFVGFLLTGLIGGLLTNLYQTRSWKIQHDIQLEEARRRSAEAVIESVARLMDKRTHLTWRVLAEPDLGRLEGGERSKYRLDYEAMLDEWYFSFNSVLAQLRVYFGSDAAEFYEYVIVSDLHTLAACMQQKSPSKAAIAHIDKKLRQISDRMYWFDIYLLQHLEGRTPNVNLRKLAAGDFRQNTSWACDGGDA